jgi:hypothetical protein
MFQKNVLPPSSGLKNEPSKKPAGTQQSKVCLPLASCWFIAEDERDMFL